MQALMMAIHILPSMLEAMFLRRGALTCDGGPWDVGLGKVVLSSSPGAAIHPTP